LGDHKNETKSTYQIESPEVEGSFLGRGIVEKFRESELREPISAIVRFTSRMANTGDLHQKKIGGGGGGVWWGGGGGGGGLNRTDSLRKNRLKKGTEGERGRGQGLGTRGSSGTTQ